MVTGFSDTWLTLREPLDTSSRNLNVLHYVQRWRHTLKTLNIIDLGCGTGANLRYLATRLGGKQHWTLVDHDAALLSTVTEYCHSWAKTNSLHIKSLPDGLHIDGTQLDCTVSFRQADLNNNLNCLLQPDYDLITASALFDLVSAHWLSELTQLCQHYHCGLLTTLNYDGDFVYIPTGDDDALIRLAFNHHQHNDKGFGPALGPDVNNWLQQRLTALGFYIHTGPSPWQISAAALKLQQHLISGHAQAAAETQPCRGSQIAAWRRCRQSQSQAHQLAITVGHQDLFALPK